jgi:hypothetical protein
VEQRVGRPDRQATGGVVATSNNPYPFPFIDVAYIADRKFLLLFVKRSASYFTCR